MAKTENIGDGQPVMFVEQFDVLIPAAGDFGYVTMVADDGAMAYVQAHDGSSGRWEDVADIVRMEKAS